MIDYSSGAGVESWAHQNRLGSVVAVSDAAGAVVEKYTYSAYGESGNEGDGGFPFRFTGQKLDAETGLYYYKARYYDPETGRFLQTDPIGYRDQMNLYGYVGNDPVNATDPTGEFLNFLIGAAIGAVFETAIQVASGEGSLKERLSNVDVGRVVAAAAVGALTGGATAFAAVAARGSTAALTTARVPLTKIAVEAGKTVANLTKGERVAAGAIAAELGTGGAVLNEKVSSDADGRDFSPTRAAAKAIVSPIPGGVTVVEEAFDKAAESQQQQVEVEQPCGDEQCK